MFDLTAADAALKVYYTDARVRNMVYKRNPFLAMVRKMPSFFGKNLPIPIIYANPQGRSADFTTALANKSSTSQVEDFVLTRVKNYGLCDIDNETIEASMNDKGAFLRAATLEIDGILHSVARDLAVDLFSDGTGARGQISAGSTVTTDTITLANISDVTNFEVGMKIEAASAKTSGSRNSGAADTITAIDRTAGTLTVGTSWDTVITAIAAGDYLFVEGDYGAGTNVKVTGLSGWLDPNAGATAFFGVDRTADLTRLAGNYYDGTSDTVEEALVNAGMRLGREGGMPDYVFMNHTHYGELLNELGSKREYSKVDVPNAQVSFKGVDVHTPNGTVTVIADQNCPLGTAFMLQMDTLCLYSLGDAPKLLTRGGSGDKGAWLRNTSSDSVEVRAGYYAQFGVNAPGANCRIALAT